MSTIRISQRVWNLHVFRFIVIYFIILNLIYVTLLIPSLKILLIKTFIFIILAIKELSFRGFIICLLKILVHLHQGGFYEFSCIFLLLLSDNRLEYSFKKIKLQETF